MRFTECTAFFAPVMDFDDAWADAEIERQLAEITIGEDSEYFSEDGDEIIDRASPFDEEQYKLPESFYELSLLTDEQIKQAEENLLECDEVLAYADRGKIFLDNVIVRSV